MNMLLTSQYKSRLSSITNIFSKRISQSDCSIQIKLNYLIFKWWLLPLIRLYWRNTIHTTPYLSWRLNILCKSSRLGRGIFYNKATHVVICEAWHFIKMWEQIYRTATYKRWVWTHTTSITPPLVVEVSLPNQESDISCICLLGVSISPPFCDLSITLCNYSDSMVYL